MDSLGSAVGLITLLALLSACATSAPESAASTAAEVSSTSASVVAEPTSSTTTEPAGDGAASFVRAVDGDTLIVRLDGQEERVRLVGIDTPEAGECLAEEAAGRLDELARSGAIRLVADESDRDDFDRLLRWVVAGEEPINRTLVVEGLAIARSYPPDTAWDDDLQAAEQQARQQELGLWSGDACGEGTGASLSVSAIHENPPGDDTLVLNEEWIEITNDGPDPIDFSGWSIRDESASNRYQFPDGFVLDAGATVRVRSGCGADDGATLHWCAAGSAIWNNGSDTAFVVDPAGNFVVSRSYG